MVGIPPVKMVMNGGWFMTLLYQHYRGIENHVGIIWDSHSFAWLDDLALEHFGGEMGIN